MPTVKTPTPAQPAVAVPSVPAPVKPPVHASPKQDDTKTLPFVKPAGKNCYNGIDHAETEKMIAKGIKNPDGSPVRVCNI